MHSHAYAQAPGHTHAHTHKQIYNTYFFSTATVIRERFPLLLYTYIASLVKDYCDGLISEWIRTQLRVDNVLFHTIQSNRQSYCFVYFKT
jgi:hypothetical protein